MSTEHLRMSDADRERVVARLNTAVGEGRLTLSEFEDRMSGVLAARTFGEVEPYFVDLPAGPLLPATSDEPLELSATGAKISRTGRWAAPATIRVRALGSSAVLDFTQAIVTTSVVRIEVQLRGSSLRLVLPNGASVDAGAASLVGSSVRVRRLAENALPDQVGVHVVVTGTLYGSSVKAAPPRRHLREWLLHRRRRLAR